MIQETIVRHARAHNVSLREAGNQIIRGFGVPPDFVDSAVEALKAEAARNEILDNPGGAFRSSRDEARQSHWYTGPVEGDVHWPAYLVASGWHEKPDQLLSLDTASTKIVAHLADPTIRGNKKKGLVVGHVQSGKTANYAAVIAKAGDAGYRIAIVMSGIHNNLRKQTQVRLDNDLRIPGLWDPLTDADADFGQVPNGTARVASRLHMLAVVKKNPSRLRRLRDWLHNIPLEARRACPILLIDDEADQATPNTRAARDEMSRINELIREIWSEVPTGTYVGYTATPFANVFMDPNDETDLYPEDFIVDLPRPGAYYGAEQIFGMPLQVSEDEVDDGLDMARVIPDAEAELLNAPTKKADREGWKPVLADSLVSATRWFLLATAARRARDGVEKHSSMLVHTTPYVEPHFKTKALVDTLLNDLVDEVTNVGLDQFKAVWDAEYPRVLPSDGREPVSWQDVTLALEDVLRSTRVVVDNGNSTDRLDYGRKGADGLELVETVIAVGGSTLSRGLTLEGLVVSYFTRAARAYDTLLQMGRWFGYRSGYEELPRVWMTSSIREDFRFLAHVEWEIREEMSSMGTRGVSPHQYGLRVRAHPGNLAITARNKMHFAQAVQISFSGQRHQTIQFEEKDSTVQLANLSAARQLLDDCVAVGESATVGSTRVFHGVGSGAVLAFLSAYRFYPGGELSGTQIVQWLNKFAADRAWNVAVVSRARERVGTVDLGPIGQVNGLVRAPLKSPTSYANIKGLMTKGDAVVDLGASAIGRVNVGEGYQAVRADADCDRGLLLLYPISKESKPVFAVETTSRRPLESPEHLIGVGIVFPPVLDGDVSEDGTFLAVRPDWTPEFDDDDDPEEFRDLENDFVASAFSGPTDGP
ncbi:Z1 domain-containing protein [Pedococcus dokdonensis]|uniref:Z1 domain-containing protein n=2 Tax=Pedococcus dokdonensis TaxID=443156 RepID=A0A1H0MD86_9MICO|nr:Z1 domain-containing protein [Pedococcus dokdonensis]